MYLVMSKGGCWVLEQPSSSLVFRLPRFQALLQHIRATLLMSYSFCSLSDFAVEEDSSSPACMCQTQVFKQRFYMGAYESKTPKATTVWSNSKAIFRLATEAWKAPPKKKKVKLVDTYIDRNGKQR